MIRTINIFKMAKIFLFRPNPHTIPDFHSPPYRGPHDGCRSHKRKLLYRRLFSNFNFSTKRNNSATLKFPATFLRRPRNYGGLNYVSHLKYLYLNWLRLGRASPVSDGWGETHPRFPTVAKIRLEYEFYTAAVKRALT